MIDFGVFPSLSLERPSVVTSFQLYVVCMMRINRLYDENKSSWSLNELRHRMFTKTNFTGDRLPLTLHVLVLHLRRALKENFSLIHEICLLLINYNFLQFYDLFFLKHQQIDNRSWDIYVFSHTESSFYTIFE